MGVLYRYYRGIIGLLQVYYVDIIDIVAVYEVFYQTFLWGDIDDYKEMTQVNIGVMRVIQVFYQVFLQRVHKGQELF